MKKFSIKIIDPRERKHYSIYCIGEIQIGDFKESFDIPLRYWSKKDYEKQWQDGIERLKTHDQSCLVTAVMLTKTTPLAILWVLYKDGDIVHIQNKALFRSRFITMLKKEFFTSQTCYNFITPRKTISESTGMKISEWDVSLEEVVKYKVPSSGSESSCDTHGELAFNKDNNWICADNSHNGGRWKMFNSKGQRKGTYDKDLNYIKE
ncbi:hypothetical protein JST99_05330 [Candidatus Dependentiae bacterium]|nr:hypothetical protein [Candidatus Dependentiae bacterium]